MKKSDKTSFNITEQSSHSEHSHGANLNQILHFGSRCKGENDSHYYLAEVPPSNFRTTKRPFLAPSMHMEEVVKPMLRGDSSPPTFALVSGSVFHTPFALMQENISKYALNNLP